jgi:ceramide glucosyltransferase
MNILSIFAYLLLGVGAIGVLASLVFLVLAFAGAWKFKRHKAQLEAQWLHEDAVLREAGKPEWSVPVSVLKPIHGVDQYLREDLERFFQQDHPSFELLFAARTRDDAGLKVVDELVAKYPHVNVRVFAVGDPPFPNAKINSLAHMVAEAKYDMLVMSDSDVGVAPNHLRRVTRVFADPKVGLSTCLYRGRHTHGFWSLIESLAYSVSMPSGVITANLLEGMKFALGPTIVARKKALEESGGLLQFQDFAAEDFYIGDRVAAAGWRVELSNVVIDHNIAPESFRAHWNHQVRWAMMGRYCRPKGHLGTGLIFAMPYGLLALAGGLLATHSFALRSTNGDTQFQLLQASSLGIMLYAVSIMKGILQSVAIGWGVVRDRKAVRFAWLYPLEDLMGFCAWMMSYIGSGKIQWRGEQYQLLMGGRMEKCR